MHNSYNFLRSNVSSHKRTYKVIIQDQADEIIDIKCSLMFGVANEASRVQSLLLFKKSNPSADKYKVDINERSGILSDKEAN